MTVIRMDQEKEDQQRKSEEEEMSDEEEKSQSFFGKLRRKSIGKPSEFSLESKVLDSH